MRRHFRLYENKNYITYVILILYSTTLEPPIKDPLRKRQPLNKGHYIPNNVQTSILSKYIFNLQKEDSLSTRAGPNVCPLLRSSTVCSYVYCVHLRGYLCITMIDIINKVLAKLVLEITTKTSECGRT